MHLKCVQSRTLQLLLKMCTNHHQFTKVLKNWTFHVVCNKNFVPKSEYKDVQSLTRAGTEANWSSATFSLAYLGHGTFGKKRAFLPKNHLFRRNEYFIVILLFSLKVLKFDWWSFSLTIWAPENYFKSSMNILSFQRLRPNLVLPPFSLW